MKIIREKTVAFSGNRILSAPKGAKTENLEETLREMLRRLIIKLYKNGYDTFISGMALGWDMLCAEEVLKLKDSCESIKLIAAIPFKGQEAEYSTCDCERYDEILKGCSYVITISKSFIDSRAYHTRNDFLVNSASKFIVYHCGKARSGTGSTMRKALQADCQVINLYDLNDTGVEL